jgi:hypothetical protein
MEANQIGTKSIWKYQNEIKSDREKQECNHQTLGLEKQ